MLRWWGSGSGRVKVVVAIVAGDGRTNDAGGKVIIVVAADGRVDNAGGGVVVVAMSRWSSLLLLVMAALGPIPLMLSCTVVTSS